MNQPRFFQEDTYHHLYNRGANKQTIFFDKRDYGFFISKMLQNKLKYEIEILAYCLMPNHFHIFIHQTQPDKLGSKFIGSIINSYTKTINKKYDRSGVLFESRTKSKIIYELDAFPILIKYILMNPVKAKLVKKFYDWEYSSAKEFLGKSNQNVTDKFIMEYFKNKNEFIKYVETEQTFSPETKKEILF